VSYLECKDTGFSERKQNNVKKDRSDHIADSALAIVSSVHKERSVMMTRTLFFVLVLWWIHTGAAYSGTDIEDGNIMLRKRKIMILLKSQSLVLIIIPNPETSLKIWRTLPSTVLFLFICTVGSPQEPSSKQGRSEI
jgi:hypothetical protein